MARTRALEKTLSEARRVQHEIEVLRSALQGLDEKDPRFQQLHKQKLARLAELERRASRL